MIDADAGDCWVILTFDAGVRYTRVKLDADWLRNCTMHHTVRMERGWVGDQCLMVANLGMLMPFHRWTNNLMHKLFLHCRYGQCCCVKLVNYFVQIHRDRQQQSDRNRNHNQNRCSAMRIAAKLYCPGTTNNQYTTPRHTPAKTEEEEN